MATTIIGLLTLAKLGTQRPKQVQLHLPQQTQKLTAISQKHLIACNRVADYLQMIAFLNVSFKPVDSTVR